MRHTVRYAASLLLLLAMTAGVALAADDPFIGKWQLDRAHSKYESGEVPQNMTITMEPADQAIHYHSETTFGNGRHSTSEYTAKYDGGWSLVRQDSGLSAPVSLKRVDANTVEAQYERGLKTFATSTRVVSSDGETLTITTSETTKEGKTTTNVSVFRRLKDL